MIRFLVLVALIPVLALAPSAALADFGPPQPPNPHPCGPCGGPPPAPTPVATLSPPVVRATVLVAVKVSPTHVARGHLTKLVVTGPPSRPLLVFAKFHHSKSIIYKGHFNHSGLLSKRWKVPKNAPLGGAWFVTQVKLASSVRTTTIAFVVTR